MRARRRRVIDEYVDPSGGSAVLVGGNVVVLSELATHVLRGLGDDWTAVEVITASLVAAFGEPPDGTDSGAITTKALVALHEQAIVDIRHG
jgi:hypothetical protein